MIFLYLVPYVFLLLIAIINNRQRGRYTDLLYIILFLFSALRYDVGYDYLSYSNIVENQLTYNMEPIQTLIINLCARTHSVQLFFVVNSLVTIFAIREANRRMSIIPSISLFVFLAWPLFFLRTLSIVRFWTAVSLVYLGISMLRNNKLILYFFLNIIALGFHTSAIICFIFPVLFRIRYSNKINYILLAASIVISLVGSVPQVGTWLEGNIFMDAFNHYIDKQENADGFTKLPYIILIADLIFLKYRREITMIDEKGEMYVNIHNIGCCIMFVLSFNSTLSSRLSLYFLVSSMLLIPLFFSLPNQKKRLWYPYIFISFFMYVFSLTIYNYSLKGYEFLPYRLFFLQ